MESDTKKIQEFNYLLCVSSPHPWTLPNAVTEKVSHKEMMEDFSDPSIDERFRSLLEKCPPIRWGLFHHPKTSSYYRDRVVLLGDSAHASLPFQAAGAAQGLEDALVLSNVIAGLLAVGEMDDAGVERGLEAYDAVRRPRAQKQIEQSEEVMRMLFFQGLEGEEGREMHEVLPRLQEGRFEWLWFHDVEGDVKEALEIMRK